MFNSEEAYEKVTKHIASGKKVMFYNYLQTLVFDQKNVSMLQLKGKSKEIYLVKGKKLTCLTGMGIKFSS